MPENPNICIIIPTYNNGRTVCSVAAKAYTMHPHVMVVDDGSTDDSLNRLKQLSDPIEVLSYPKNTGKGHALQVGFQRALSKGYTHALTMDADGQHLPSDIPHLLEVTDAHPNATIVGCRTFGVANMPKANTFANRFSNFWFTLLTFHSLDDTQTGLRVYPLERMKRMHLFTPRYEAELELLVRLTWRGVPVINSPVHVYYPPKEERVTHFRKGKDFMRISLLYTVLFFVAFFYGYPSLLLRKIKW